MWCVYVTKHTGVSVIVLQTLNVQIHLTYKFYPYGYRDSLSIRTIYSTSAVTETRTDTETPFVRKPRWLRYRYGIDQIFS